MSRHPITKHRASQRDDERALFEAAVGMGIEDALHLISEDEAEYLRLWYGMTGDMRHHYEAWGATYGTAVSEPDPTMWRTRLLLKLALAIGAERCHNVNRGKP